MIPQARRAARGTMSSHAVAILAGAEAKVIDVEANAEPAPRDQRQHARGGRRCRHMVHHAAPDEVVVAVDGFECPTRACEAGT